MSYIDNPTPFDESPNYIPIELFEQQIQSTCGLFNVRPTAGANRVWGGVSARMQMGLGITNVNADLQQIQRTTKCIRQDDIDDYFLVIQRQGRILMQQGDKSVVLHPGDMILIDSAHPSEFSIFGDRSKSVSLHVPRADLEARFGYNIPGGIALRAGDPTAMAIEAIIAKSNAPSDADVHLQHALYNMLGVALLDRNLGCQSSSSISKKHECSVLSKAVSYVETRHTDPDVKPSMIADDLGLQPHQVQRAFKSIGTTATKYLLTKRLETARTLLVKRSGMPQPDLVSTAAYSAGFSDISYFNRRYREAFGCTPKATQSM